MENQRVFEDLEILVHGGTGYLGIVADVGKINDCAIAQRRNSKEPAKGRDVASRPFGNNFLL